MTNEPLKVTWTSTLDSANDAKFIDKIIQYGHVNYLSFPLNHPGEITKRTSEFSYPTVEARILRDQAIYDAQLRRLRPIIESDAIIQITANQENDIDPFWNNGFFNGSDAKLGYAFLVDRNPQLVVEVGAGNSTKFFRRAIHDFGLQTRLLAIDPAPRADLAQVADEIIESSVFDVHLAVFDRLEAGDILFWDGSHMVCNGSDVTRLFLEVLPRLKPGVIVHMHDIMMPYEAYHNGEVGDVSFPEQYMLGTYLLSVASAKVLLPVHYLWRTKAITENGLSFWFVTE